MAVVVLDYSYARPDPNELARHSIGVMRYLGYGPKVLTIPERDRLFHAGLDVGLVWETTRGMMDEGYGAGRRDAMLANRQADELGFGHRPIYYANDQNASRPEHLEYAKGARDAGIRPIGVYGNTAFLEACHHKLGVQYLWKVSTWGGPLHLATLTQEANIYPPVASTDVNHVHADDWGQWHYVEPVPERRREAMLLWGS